MSIKHKNHDYFLVDHREYITHLYQNVYCSNERTVSLSLLARLFSIVADKKRTNNYDNNRKRTHDSDAFHDETGKVKALYDNFIEDLPLAIRGGMNKYNLLETSAVRDMAKKLFEMTIFDFNGVNGGNNSDQPLKCKVKDEFFLIPHRSRFFCGCVKEQCRKIEGIKFDIVIADPPWWNKYIRRLKNANDKLSYSMMYNEDIASIPLQNLLSDKCLIAMWCTNAPSHITAVQNLIFPKWGVEYVTTWYWLKVTVDLEPICPFGSGCRKQPYERLILGKIGDVRNIPDSKLIVSVPSALHSHKPPLLELLSPYVKSEHPQTLELFARYLLPNTTSVGYEPLKWQHISLYEDVDSEAK